MQLPDMERVMRAAQFLKSNGFEDVVPLLMRNQAQTIRGNRPKRKRGMKVRLGNARGPHAVLDAEIVERAMEGTQ